MFSFRNVNDSFRAMVELFRQSDKLPALMARETSRNGPVVSSRMPLTFRYSHPHERVLLNTGRDANPFFHLYEALWCLAGRNDVASLAYYNSRMKDFSDDGRTLNGAYGYRWRNHEERVRDTTGLSVTQADQLGVLVEHLKAVPNSRRAVLQMWNVEDDLLKIGGGPGVPDIGDVTVGLHPGSRDVCCNLCVMFALRPALSAAYGTKEYYTDGGLVRALDMTVINRSNDLVWGMLGANYVQFTVLQEYVAAKLGVEVGAYYHVTNNLHAYVERKDWDPNLWLMSPHPTYDGLGEPLVPLVKDAARFDDVLPRFVDYHSRQRSGTRLWSEPFFDGVASPMLEAFHMYKGGNGPAALIHAGSIQSPDWRHAAEAWLTKRSEKKDGKP